MTKTEPFCGVSFTTWSHGKHNLLQQSFLAEPEIEDLFKLNEGVSVVLHSMTRRAENVAFRTVKKKPY